MGLGPDLGPHSRQKTSDGNGDLRGVWVDGGLRRVRFEKRVLEMDPKNRVSKMGSKNRPKNGVQKWAPKWAPKAGRHSNSIQALFLRPIFGVYF